MPRSHSSDIDRLIQIMARLPGLGPRSARRGVLQLLKKRDSLMRPLASTLDQVANAVMICSSCGNIDTSDPCYVCSDNRRDHSTLCVVEDVADLWALDRSETFRGQYHILGGTLSALDGVSPDDLSVDALVERASSENVQEVILALGATVEGQTTSHYLVERLAGCGVKVTGLAHGVPLGGELDNLDDGTIATALRARSEIN